MKQYTTFKVLPNYNLEISLTPAGREYISKLHTQIRQGEKTETETFEELIEFNMQHYFYVNPNHICGHTKSILISDSLIDENSSAKTINEAQIWWFTDNAIFMEFDVLLHNSTIIFETYYNN